MRRRAKLGLGLGGLLLAGLVLIGGRIAYVETACRAAPEGQDFAPAITDHVWQRPEPRTFLTYPEWHMVYAYEDLAETLKTGDEHDFDYGRSVASFWSSYCALNRLADAHGGADGPTRQMIYVIGTSFDIEMGLKAGYEETIGRFTAWMRGPEKTPQDAIAAEMAEAYGAFLHQVPWYRFPFREWVARLDAAPAEGLRGVERRWALGAEWRAKQLYADAIAGAVAATGADELRIRSVVADLSPEVLQAMAGVSLIGPAATGTVIETDRYAAYTDLLRRLAAAGGDLAEIAGNDDVMISVVAPPGTAGLGADTLVRAFAPMADGRVRSLHLLKVAALLPTLRGASAGGYEVEHVFDY
ncbi:hypothetical protein [Aureimonas sp. ME7]|uniref:hypothetical protein n=1 Tax=Aureimonas sp. ME7 TaxID=2744252 RepID=UPI0015F37DD5|nr:hypothetical protein [Aureimonas sp. ME7]